MFGISTSVFNEAGGLIKDWLKNPLNASFLYWYFLPSVGVVLVHLFPIGPALGHRAPEVFSIEVGPAKSPADLILQMLNASVLVLVLLPLVIGILLFSLSGTILRCYQGTLPLVHWLFQPWLRRNQKRSRERYGSLEAKRREYLFLILQGLRLVLVDGKERGVSVSESEVSALAGQLKAEIQAPHERLEQISGERELPVAVERVGPNDLANTLAIAEEYPFERYRVGGGIGNDHFVLNAKGMFAANC